MSVRNVEQDFDALKADFGKLSADLVNLTAALRDATGQGAQEYLAKVRSFTDQGSEDVQAAAAALGARGRDAMNSVGEQIRDRPLMSLLICFGLGIVIGKLIDR